MATPSILRIEGERLVNPEGDGYVADATTVAYDPTDTDLVSVDVQEAVDELALTRATVGYVDAAQEAAEDYADTLLESVRPRVIVEITATYSIDLSSWGGHDPGSTELVILCTPPTAVNITVNLPSVISRIHGMQITVVNYSTNNSVTVASAASDIVRGIAGPYPVGHTATTYVLVDSATGATASWIWGGYGSGSRWRPVSITGGTAYMGVSGLLLSARMIACKTDNTAGAANGLVMNDYSIVCVAGGGGSFGIASLPAATNSALIRGNSTLQWAASGNDTVLRRTGSGELGFGKLTASHFNTGVVPAASDANPASVGTTAPGTSVDFSRADHVHALGTGVVSNTHVASAAAIAGTKISPDFGSQNIVTTGNATAADPSAPGHLTTRSWVETQIGAAKLLPPVVYSGTGRNLDLADIGTTVVCTASSPVELIVDKFSSTPSPVGAVIHILQLDGQVTVAPIDGDVTIITSETLKTRKIGSYVFLHHVLEDTWVLSGERELAP